MNIPSVTGLWLRHKLYSKRGKIYPLSAAPGGVSTRVLVSDRSLATQVEVEVLPETPEDSRCVPCFRCSFVGNHNWFKLHDYKTAYLCEVCAAEAILSGDTELHMGRGECPTCTRIDIRNVLTP